MEIIPYVLQDIIPCYTAVRKAMVIIPNKLLVSNHDEGIWRGMGRRNAEHHGSGGARCNDAGCDSWKIS